MPTGDRRVAEELWKMALEYQAKAAALDGGQKPDIGPAPYFLTEPRIVRATWPVKKNNGP